jgi:hypothetical protein
MSLLRKSLLAVVPVVALCVPFMAASPARADGHHEHHEHWEHHEHFPHYPYHWYGGFRPSLVIEPSVIVSPTLVSPAPVTLFYRVNPYSPWVAYGTFPGFDAANSLSLSLRTRGFEVFIR